MLLQSLLLIGVEFLLLHGFLQDFCWFWIWNLPLFVRNLSLNFQIWYLNFPWDNVLHYLLLCRLFLCSSRSRAFWAWCRIESEFFLIQISSSVSWDLPEHIWSGFAGLDHAMDWFWSSGRSCFLNCSFRQPVFRWIWIFISVFHRAFCADHRKIVAPGLLQNIQKTLHEKLVRVRRNRHSFWLL